MYTKHFTLWMCLAAITSTVAMSQPYLHSDVRSFQSFFRDGTIVGSPYVDGGIVFSDYDFLNTFALGARGGLPITNAFEIGASLALFSIDPEAGDGETGLTDLEVSGRYLVLDDENQVTVGGFITLPIGDEDIGQSRTNFGIFGALRYPASEDITILGNAGLDLLDFADYEASLNLGGGAIFKTESDLSILAELAIQTFTDVVLLSGGVDYPITGARLRGSLGVGLDDGAPDFQLALSALLMQQ